MTKITTSLLIHFIAVFNLVAISTDFLSYDSSDSTDFIQSISKDIRHIYSTDLLGLIVPKPDRQLNYGIGYSSEGEEEETIDEYYQKQRKRLRDNTHGKELNFLVLGDFGFVGENGPEPSTKKLADMITNRVKKSSIHYDFILSVGDNIYPDGVVSTTDPVPKLLLEDTFNMSKLGLDWYSVLGNHDCMGNMPATFKLPNQFPLWKQREAYYYKIFNIGSSEKKAGFVFLNGCDLVCKNKFSSECFEKMWKNVQFDKITEQIDWLNTTLSDMAQDKTITWKVVVVHWALFSAGENHGDNEALKEAVLPLLLQYKVDVVLSGHDHSVQYLRMDLDIHERLQDATTEKKWDNSDSELDFSTDEIDVSVEVEVEVTINNKTNTSIECSSPVKNRTEVRLNATETITNGTKLSSNSTNSVAKNLTISQNNTISANISKLSNDTSADASKHKKKEACPNEIDYSYCSAQEYFHYELTKCGIIEKHNQQRSISRLSSHDNIHGLDPYEVKFSRESVAPQHEYLHQFVIGNGGEELEKICALRHRRSHGRLRYGNSILGIGDVRITEQRLQVKFLSETNEILYSVNIFKGVTNEE